MKKYLLALLIPTSSLADNLSPAGMTQVMSGVDDKAVSIEMGHTFPWLDQVFTHAWMSTNGFVLMYNPTTGIGKQSAPLYGYCCDGYSHATGMPTYMPRDYGLGSFSYMIAPLWTDLDDTSADADAGYFYKTDSDSTSFLWNKVRQYATTNENTFGLTLDRTGGFKFEYEDINVNFHHKAFVGWYGGPNFPNGDGYGGSWTQEYSMNGFTTTDIMNYGGPTDFGVNDGVASLIMSSSTLSQEQGGGGGQQSAPPTFAEQATNTVFGDSADDFLYLDQPDATGRPRILSQISQPQIYQDAPQEQILGRQAQVTTPTGEPRSPDRQQQERAPEQTEQVVEAREERQVEERVTRPVQVATEVRADPVAVSVVREPQAEARVVAEAPQVEVAKEAKADPTARAATAAVRQAFDAVGFTLSFFDSQRPQNFTQGNQPDAPVDAIQMGQQITQALEVQSQSQAENTMTQEELAPPSQVQFEQDFNDALATGQSLGQFLSAQLPDFSRFNVQPPSQQEVRTVQRAEAQLQTLSQGQIEQSLENELEDLADTGGFSDQSLAVLLLANNPAFLAYDTAEIADRDEFYLSTQVYPNSVPRSDPLGVLRVVGSDSYEQMVGEQWQR